MSIQSWLGVLVPHSSTEDAPDVSNGEIIAIDSDSTVALPFQPIQADVSTESSTSDAVYLAENSTAEALGHPLEIQSSTLPDLPVAQQDLIVPENEADSIRELILRVQGVYQLQGDESSARLRVIGSYVFNPNLLVGGTAEVSYGDAFTSSDDVEFALNELYLTISPEEIPNVRLTVGLMDLTSYFDRNSFAKDDTIHFFNSVFETNPALSAAGIDSRPGVLLNWSVIDNLEVRAAAFSSSRDLDEFAIDAFAGEVAMRFGNAIVRGTYVTDRDAGYRTGFNEIFQFDRGDGFGLDADDREQAYGINAEFFIPELNLGLFGRYGWYENLELDRSANTFNFGINVLNLFMLDDRLGLGYGRELSNDNLREDRGDETPDVMELFYDFRITPNVRVGTTAQLRDEFSESVFGFRIRADFDVTELGRLFR
ncbi:MAG: carbohydrate porin [Cyanobacteria bacterium CRU_2_1]|nr:carbohydrate porin [Cyanobacteria bacterium CRU_2_1]